MATSGLKGNHQTSWNSKISLGLLGHHLEMSINQSILIPKKCNMGYQLLYILYNMLSILPDQVRRAQRSLSSLVLCLWIPCIMILHCLVMQVKLGWLLGICMSGVRFNNEQSSKNCVSMSWVGLNKSRVSRIGGHGWGPPHQTPAPSMEACPPPSRKT